MSLFSCCQTNSSNYVYQVKIEDKKKGEIKTQQYPSFKNLPDNIELYKGIIKLKKSDYESLRKKHSQNDDKFTDMHFPPNATSLGKIDGIDENCQWKRISEIIQNPQLFDGTIQPSDVISGSLDTCYFLSAIAALAEDDSRIYQIFESQKYNPQGIYKLKLRIFGNIKQIIVDDYVPVDEEGKPLFCQPKKRQFWVLIIQKAWAKIKGSYANIEIGDPQEVFKAVTFAPTKILPITPGEQEREALWQELKEDVQLQRPICVGTVAEPSKEQQQTNNGLVWGHYYTLMDAKIIKAKDSLQWHKILKLRNPWGRVQWQGKYCQTDEQFWQKVKKQEKQSLWDGMGKQNDGIFFMEWKDFCRFFNTANICYYLKNPCYQNQTIYPDRKHGNMYTLGIKKEGQYIIELHQTINKQNYKDPTDKIGITYSQANRATVCIMQAKDLQFIDGVFTYDDYDSTVKVDLEPGKYLVYAKIDGIEDQNGKKDELLFPRKISLSVYSKFWISSLKGIDKNKITPGERFYHKMFIEHARSNKKKVYDNERLWISYKQFSQRAGFAYICFGVQLMSNNKFYVSFKEKDFNDNYFVLKKPYKGKGDIQFEVLPGRQNFIIARVMKGAEKNVLNFPPPMNVKIKSI